MLMQQKSAVESNAQVSNWKAEFNTSAINIHEFWINWDTTTFSRILDTNDKLETGR